jgi:hypothetical protein
MVKGQGSRVKGQWSMVKGQGSRDNIFSVLTVDFLTLDSLTLDYFPNSCDRAVAALTASIKAERKPAFSS